MPKPVTELTRAQLIAAHDRADRMFCAACTALIQAGRGRECLLEIRTKCDALSVRWVKAADRCAELSREEMRRRKHHGSLHRTR